MILRLTQIFKQNAAGNVLDAEGKLMVEKMAMEELCPTCKQPMPRDATTANPRAERGTIAPKCQFCGKPASFIIRNKFVCYDCRGQA